MQKIDTMKHLLPLLIIGLMAASCTEEPLPEPQPTEYQVRFEVECDSCEAWYAINGINPPVGDSVFTFYSMDTTVFQGDGVSITGIAQNGETDSIRVRILSDGVILSDTIAYKDSPDDLFVFAFTVHVFE